LAFDEQGQRPKEGLSFLFWGGERGLAGFLLLLLCGGATEKGRQKGSLSSLVCRLSCVVCRLSSVVCRVFVFAFVRFIVVCLASDRPVSQSWDLIGPAAVRTKPSRPPARRRQDRTVCSAQTALGPSRALRPLHLRVAPSAPHEDARKREAERLREERKRTLQRVGCAGGDGGAGGGQGELGAGCCVCTMCWRLLGGVMVCARAAPRPSIWRPWQSAAPG